MRNILVILAACAAIPALVQAQTAAQPAVTATSQEEADRLARSKFEPISAVAAEGRTLRRVSYTDAFGTSAMPAVTIEKLANGEIKMTMVASGGAVEETATVTQADWDRLMAMDSQIMAKPKVQLTAAEAKMICHSNSIVIEASDEGRTRRRDASHCKKDTEAMLYGYAVADIAVRNIPRCKSVIAPDREASWQLTECMRERRRAPNPTRVD